MAAKKKTAGTGAETPTFETSLEALEGIVRRLEGGDLGVEEAMAEYEKGLEALKRCRGILDEAEKKLEILVREKDGQAQTRPFEVNEEGEEAPGPKKGGGRKGKPAGEEGPPKGGFLF